MSIYDLLMAVAAFLIMITMFARLNALRPDVHRTAIWWVRRIAFLQVIAACAMVMAAPVARNVPHWRELTNMMFAWGVFWVFFTSPYQKPWWELIMGDHRKGHADVKSRLADEWKALRQGFRAGEITERRSGPADRRRGNLDRRTDGE